MKEPRPRASARPDTATITPQSEPGADGAEAAVEVAAPARRAAVSPARPKAVSRRKSISSNPVRNVSTIIGKELQSYFASPIAYLVITAFLVMNGYLYSIILFSSRQASLTSEFSDMAIILLFLSPAITMRLLSEEQRQGTIELLLTSPIRDAELVMGKWLASMAFFLVMLVLTATFPLFLIRFGNPDLGTMLAGYLGVLLLEGVFLAIGLLMSSLTQNQIVALALSFGILLVLWLFQGAGQNFGQGGGSAFLQFLALSQHFDGFTSGAIQLKDLVYYVSLIALALFLTVRSVETRRWR